MLNVLNWLLEYSLCYNTPFQGSTEWNIFYLNSNIEVSLNETQIKHSLALKEFTFRSEPEICRLQLIPASTAQLLSVK